MIKKSTGITNTEKFLSSLCERTFLKLWSYPNPFKKDKKELCDLLVVFDNHVFIFFDRKSDQFEKSGNDILVSWERWKRKVIDSQISTALGAERYIQSGSEIFLDSKLNELFPIPIDYEKAIIHKIIIANGAEKACKNYSKDNVYGSLAISYSENPNNSSQTPFMVYLDKKNPIHIFDSYNLPIALNELDTYYEFSNYLLAKEKAIAKYRCLLYAGEEDLIANYFLNFDEKAKNHFIGIDKENVDTFMVGEGEWQDFFNSKSYKAKKAADADSYLWDELLQYTSENALKGVLGGNSNVFVGDSAIFEMAKEPRFVRRGLASRIKEAISNFPDAKTKVTTYLSFNYSFYKDKGYVFMQVHVNDHGDYESEYRPRRNKLLEIACGVAKNKFSELTMVIGIVIDAPRYSPNFNSDDFILLRCSDWTKDDEDYYNDANKATNFFRSKNLKTKQVKFREFPI